MSHNDGAFDALKGSDPAKGVDSSAGKIALAAVRRAEQEASSSRALQKRRYLAGSAIALMLVGVTGASSYLAGERSGSIEASGAEGRGEMPMVGAEPAPDGFSTESIAPWGGERMSFVNGGLSGEAGKSEIWAYDPSSTFNQETAQRVAAGVGLDGEARLEWGVWTVGDTAGRYLQIYSDSSSSVNYYNSELDPYRCGESAPDQPTRTEIGGVIEGAYAALMPECSTEGAPQALEEEAAQLKTYELLSALGEDPSQFNLGYEVGDGSATVWAEGEGTGRQWNFTWVGDQTLSFYGSLAPLVSLGEYSTISAEEAFARISDTRFGFERVYDNPTLMMEEGGAMTSPEEPSADQKPQLPTLPTPGEPLPWPVEEVVLTGAMLENEQYVTSTGGMMMLPYWKLSDDAGGTWKVMALSEDALVTAK